MHLPDAVINNISLQLLQQPDSQAAIVSLVSMCGVCQQWRDVARHLDGGVVHLDALQTCGRNKLGRALTPTEIKFRGSSVPAKKAFFQSAARLFTGYTELVLAGEGISDVTLLEAARAAGDKLVSVEVKDTSTVTDAGFASLALFTSRLKSLRLTNLPRVRGAFIAGLLERCPGLEVLHLENLPRCWEGQGFSSAMAVRARSLHTVSILGCKVDISAAALLAKVPELRCFSYDGPASLMRLLCTFCPKLEEVCYSSSCQESVSETIRCLLGARKLRMLDITPRNMMLSPDQLHTLGLLPLTELRLNSFMYNQQPAINRASQSHLDNEGVRALVDSICHRVNARAGQESRPFKLSLCGATALTHDAVSALLRLPLLSELKIDGCFRINSMDKMRLVAKVKAGASLGAGGALGCGRSASESARDQRAFAFHMHRMLRTAA